MFCVCVRVRVQLIQVWDLGFRVTNLGFFCLSRLDSCFYFEFVLTLSSPFVLSLLSVIYQKKKRHDWGLRLLDLFVLVIITRRNDYSEVLSGHEHRDRQRSGAAPLHGDGVISPQGDSSGETVQVGWKEKQI